MTTLYPCQMLAVLIAPEGKKLQCEGPLWVRESGLGADRPQRRARGWIGQDVAPRRLPRVSCAENSLSSDQDGTVRFLKSEKSPRLLLASGAFS